MTARDDAKAMTTDELLLEIGVIAVNVGSCGVDEWNVAYWSHDGNSRLVADGETLRDALIAAAEFGGLPDIERA